MKKIFLPQQLLDAIHDKTIVVNYSGTKMEVSEKSFLAAVDIDRNDFEIDVYNIKVGEKQLVVIQNMQLKPKFMVRVHNPVIKMHKKWYQVAASLLN